MLLKKSFICLGKFVNTFYLNLGPVNFELNYYKKNSEWKDKWRFQVLHHNTTVWEFTRSKLALSIF